MSVEAPPVTKGVLHVIGIRNPLVVNELPGEVQALVDEAVAAGERWIVVTEGTNNYPIRVLAGNVAVIHHGQRP